MIKHSEIKTYEYCGVNVTVVIDFDKGQITLAEKKMGYGFVKKNWVFAERELSYMNGWRNILEAMKYAIDEAEKELKGYQEARRKEKEEDVMTALNLATDIIKNKKPKGKK